jgi:branched-chain amino acid transport system permease protein
VKWLDITLAALLHAPILALLAVAFGLGQRFGVRCEVWAGAAAVVAAVTGGWLGDVTGIGPVPNAAIAVPLVFAVAYLLGVFVTTRPEIGGDPTRLFTVSALLAVAAVSVLLVWRGDAAVAVSDLIEGWELFGGPSISREAVITAIVALVGLAALAAVVTISRFRMRLVVMDRAPELLERAGHDARQVSALFGALTASAAALAGILASRHSPLAPTSALALTVLGAETAMLGGLGSISGALGAALVVSLLADLGNEFRAGWGTLAVHLLVLAVLVGRRGFVGRWSESPWEVAG